MALETVEITVQDDQVIPQLVDNVVVRIYDSTGTLFITAGTTGVPLPGKVQVTLPGGGPIPITYQLRFYVNGGQIPSPQYINVYSPPTLAPVTGTNNFLITAHMFSLPDATNPRLCRASGYIWGPDGRPHRGIDIAFIPCFDPLVVDGIGVLGERRNIKTDKDGYVQIDLWRDGMYEATVESQENVTRIVSVPDMPSINIMHLLFPIVVKVTYAPVGPFFLAVGGTQIVTPSIQASDYHVLAGTASEDVLYAVDDPTIASVLIQQNTIVLNGLTPGTTNLRVTRKDSSIVYIPDPGIDGALIPITVT